MCLKFGGDCACKLARIVRRVSSLGTIVRVSLCQKIKSGGVPSPQARPSDMVATVSRRSRPPRRKCLCLCTPPAACTAAAAVAWHQPLRRRRISRRLLRLHHPTTRRHFLPGCRWARWATATALAASRRRRHAYPHMGAPNKLAPAEAIQQKTLLEAQLRNSEAQLACLRAEKEAAELRARLAESRAARKGRD